MTLLFYLRSSNGSVAPGPIQWYEGGEFSRAEIRKRKKKKFKTTKEIEDGKRLKKRDEEEFLIFFLLDEE